MKAKNRVKNRTKKRAWIRIVEAFVAIMIIISVLLVTLGEGYIDKIRMQRKIYESERAILKNIELNSSFRERILELESLPVSWQSEDFPSEIKTKIENLKPGYLECEAKICSISDPCVQDSNPSKDVYAKAVVIAASSEKYAPRQLKIFCWEE